MHDVIQGEVYLRFLFTGKIVKLYGRHSKKLIICLRKKKKAENIVVRGHFIMTYTFVMHLQILFIKFI